MLGIIAAYSQLLKICSAIWDYSDIITSDSYYEQIQDLKCKDKNDSAQLDCHNEL